MYIENNSNSNKNGGYTASIIWEVVSWNDLEKLIPL